MSDEHRPQDGKDDSDGPSRFASGDREWQQVWEVGEYRVEAIFAVLNGVELPWPVRVDVAGPDVVTRLGGRNLLPRAFLIAEALSRNPIRD